jgi:hypothetical protein
MEHHKLGKRAREEINGKHANKENVGVKMEVQEGSGVSSAEKESKKKRDAGRAGRMEVVRTKRKIKKITGVRK